MPLQRVIADFGADHAFGQVPTKLQEHYGIQIPVSTIRKITELHGQQMHEQRQASSLPVDSGCQQQIAEIDGCMLPVITIRDDEGDKRKKKVLHWKEARLALVHEQGSVTGPLHFPVHSLGKTLANACDFGKNHATLNIARDPPY